MNVSFTLRAVLQDAVTRLTLAGIMESRFEAEILLANVLSVSRSYLHAFPEKSLDASQIKTFQDYLHRRSQHEPIAYILGRKEFWSLSFKVTNATLIPRPETELLVETALSLEASIRPNAKVADLGTGSGAIALALAHKKPSWQIVATDSDADALSVAKENALHLEIANVSFQRGEWFLALQENDYDMIVSNPPYLSEAEWPVYADNLRYEPYHALVSGSDGLQAIRQICLGAPACLRSGGFLLIEHGFSQAEKVQACFRQAGFHTITTYKDLAGHDRVTVGMRYF